VTDQKCCITRARAMCTRARARACACTRMRACERREGVALLMHLYRCCAVVKQQRLHSWWLVKPIHWPDRSTRNAGPGRGAIPIMKSI